MAEAPQPEGIFQVGQFLAQLVQVPVRLRVAVHDQPGLFDLGIGLVGLCPVALQAGGRQRDAAARQQAQGLVIQRGRLVGSLHHRQQVRPMLVRLEHRRILVAQRKLDAAVLRALESARVGQVGPDRAVFGGRHRGQHVPGVHQLLHDPAYPRQHLEGAAQFIRSDATDRAVQFVQHQFHPQLAGLVLDDEQHLVVVGRQRLLRVQHLVEMQVVAITHGPAEVELGLFLGDDVFGGGHGRAFGDCRRSCSGDGLLAVERG